MHGIQNVEDQNESTKEVVVNDNKEKKHIVQHINKPKEVPVENNNNQDKELDTPDMKKHDVDNDCKEDDDIQHYNDEYKDDTSNNCEKQKNVEEYHHGNKGSGSVLNHDDKKEENPENPPFITEETYVK